MPFHKMEDGPDVHYVAERSTKKGETPIQEGETLLLERAINPGTNAKADFVMVLPTGRKFPKMMWNAVLLHIVKPSPALQDHPTLLPHCWAYGYTKKGALKRLSKEEENSVSRLAIALAEGRVKMGILDMGSPDDWS